MATFLTSNQLNTGVENILEQAEEILILISPYIKLHERYASVLKTKRGMPSLQIIIVFGKNADDFSKSMKQEDFNFFKEFPNIEIRYEKRLHAKYYANERTAILTSMNLYNFSQDNNIEAGVLTTRKGLIGDLTGQNNLDNETANCFERVIDQAELLFKKVPQFESRNLGFTEKYINSVIEEDKLSEHFENKINGSMSKSDNFNAKFKIQTKKSQAGNLLGYCIRTGVQIPFNPKIPMSDTAFQNWKKFSNSEYAEKFCHYSGEPSNGETSLSRPILKKNWKKAKGFFAL